MAKYFLKSCPEQLILFIGKVFVHQITDLVQPTYLEIVDAGVDKGKALSAVAERLGVAREEVAAFGDAGNDLGMLAYAGRGYAMENASEDVLARVPLHAPANTDDGVAQVLEDLLARGEIGG